MALPPGATARDRWLDLADDARAKRQDALAEGNLHMAGLWDEEERRLLGLAYSDAPAPANDDAASAGGGPETSFEPDAVSPADDIKTASADDDPSAIDELIVAANSLLTQNGGTAPKPAKQAPPVPLPAPARSVEDRAKVIFGETSGLYPQSIDPEGPENDPRNWAI